MEDRCKEFNVMTRIGKAKYVVNYHDGVKTHNDGSPFSDIAIFKNQVQLGRFIFNLLTAGYKER